MHIIFWQRVLYQAALLHFASIVMQIVLAAVDNPDGAKRLLRQAVPSLGHGLTADDGVKGDYWHAQEIIFRTTAPNHACYGGQSFDVVL